MFGCALLTPCCRDTLAYQKRRMNLNESRVEAEVFLGDYWRRRSNPEEDFKLCRKCPQPAVLLQTDLLQAQHCVMCCLLKHLAQVPSI